MDKVRSMARRSFLAQVAGGGLILGAGVLPARSAEARPRPRQMVVDRDPRDPARSVEEEARRRRRVVGREFEDRRYRQGSDARIERPDRGGFTAGLLGEVSGGGAAPPSRFVICPGNRRCPGRNR